VTIRLGRRLSSSALGRLVRYCLCVLVILACSVCVIAQSQAQVGETCGSLRVQISPDDGHRISTSGSWFIFQVFRKSGTDEAPILAGLPSSTSKPSARCFRASVLAVVFEGVSGEPEVQLVFQDGRHLLEALSWSDLEWRGDVIVIPARLRLVEEARGRVPAEYRDLFDYKSR